MRKKGIGLGEAFGAVLTLILIAILIIVGIYLFVVLSTSSKISVTSINETIVMTGSAVAISNITSCGYTSGSASLSEVWNDTTLVPSTNYTYVQANGTLVNRSNIYGPSWRATYTYEYGGNVCSSSNTMVVAFGTFPALLGLVGTIIFLGIVIGVLVGSFVFRGGRA